MMVCWAEESGVEAWGPSGQAKEAKEPQATLGLILKPDARAGPQPKSTDKREGLQTRRARGKKKEKAIINPYSVLRRVNPCQGLGKLTDCTTCPVESLR